MLYVFYGESFWAREKISELGQKALKKNYEIFNLDENSQTPLNSFLARDLFGKKVFLIGRHLLEGDEYSGELNSLARDLSGSENIIVLLEGELEERWHKIFKDAGAKLHQFKTPPRSRLLSWLSQKAKEAGADFSPAELEILISEYGPEPYTLLNRLERFSLEKSKPLAPQRKAVAGNYFHFADAVFGKKKYQALSLLRSYIKEGFGAEEAFWKLWWKIKTLRLVDSGEKSTGLHPYVQKKALEDLRNFSSAELKKLSYDLLDIFSEVRRGEENFEEGLEKILIRS